MKSDLIKNLLEKRGIYGEIEQDIFLYPDWNRDIHDPFLMKHMDRAVERLRKTINSKEKILIYSDYDCDGIPGGVILYDFFKKIESSANIEIDFQNYIPHRHKEGYGIHKEAIDGFIRNGIKLIITVDLGITNIEQIEYAQKNGIDVILTDHHLPINDKDKGQIIPRAYAVINTKQNDCLYPEKMLCGCATVWKLVNAFLVKHRAEYNIPDGYEKWWLDMVGISTIADMVPLVGENRVLAKYGLDVLKKTKRQGLLKIYQNAKIDKYNINETDIGFSIAPRLNAAGRMSDPVYAFRALINNMDSDIYADELEKLNRDRKLETNQANTSIDYENFLQEEIIFTGSKNWTPGILGLIASKITDNTNKTVFVWGMGEDENIMKGSVRSGMDGANVVNLMNECKDVLHHFGGHEEAGGFAVHIDKLDELHDRLKISYKNQKENFVSKDKKINIDIKIKSENLNNDLYKELQAMAPFGVGNSNPIVALKGELKGVRYFGDKGQHVEINVDGASTVKFNLTDQDKKEIQNQKDKNEWVGVIEWDNYKNKARLKLI